MSQIERVGAADACAAGLIARPSLNDEVSAPSATFDVVCIGPDGHEKWRDTARNIVTLQGKTRALDTLFGAQAKETWYIILKGTVTAAVVADTLASKVWTEYTNYTPATRPAITFGAAATVNTSGAEVTNASNTPVDFTISGAGGTVYGAGICNAATGTTGQLYNASDFTGGQKAVTAGDTLRVTIRLSFAA